MLLTEPTHSVVGQALFRQRRHFLVVALISAAANVLLLTGPIFMLQVYDRVLSSGSIPTLVVLAAIVAVCFAFLGAFDWVRLLIMGRIAVLFDSEITPKAFGAALSAPSAPGEMTRDAETMRQFLSSSGPMFFFDLPWLPVFLGIVWLFHPILGLVATLGGVVLIALSYLNQRAVSPCVEATSQHWIDRNRVAGAAFRHRETVAALGMGPALSSRFLAADDRLVRAQLGAG